MNFDLNPNVSIIQYSAYSVFDFMRDLGGFLFMTVSLFSFVNGITTFNKLENNLVAKLYKKPQQDWKNKDIYDIDDNLYASG